MPSGLPSYNVVNLSDLDQAFESGAVVDLAAIEAKNLLNISGRDKKLPLKVGEGIRGLRFAGRQGVGSLQMESSCEEGWVWGVGGIVAVCGMYRGVVTVSSGLLVAAAGAGQRVGCLHGFGACSPGVSSW